MRKGPVTGAKGVANPWSVVFVVAAVVFVASLVALGVIGLSYLQGQQKYRELEETAFDESTGIDWAVLRAANPDTVGWVYIPGTTVNYPVVQGGDNEYYLSHDFYGEEAWLASYGAIFMDYRNAPDWNDDAYFIYGHHMNDGSMFATIASLADQVRFDECRTVFFYTPEKDFELRTFALVHCASTEAIVQTAFESAEALQAYVADKIDRSVVNAGAPPDEGALQKVFAFATCDNVGDGRYVLYACLKDGTSESNLIDEGLPQNGDGDGR